MSHPVIALSLENTYLDLHLLALSLLSVLSVQNRTPVLVQLDRSDNDIAGVDANGDGSTVRLVALDTVDVDDPLLTVHLGHLALPTLVLAPNDPDLIVLAYR